MATTKHTVQGKAFWAKVFEHNRDMQGFQGSAIPVEGFYKIDVQLDKDQRKVFTASGSAKKGRWDDDGNYLVTLKRDHKGKFEWCSGAPKVFNKDGNDFTGRIIPNGSEVEVEFSVYTTSKANGTRLESVKVLELAEMAEREEMGKAPPEPKASPKSTTPDDELPF